MFDCAGLQPRFDPIVNSVVPQQLLERDTCSELRKS